MCAKSGEPFSKGEQGLSTGYLEALFPGSVGLSIDGPIAPATGEQMAAFEPTLYERSVERVIKVLKAAESDDVEATVLELAAGLSPEAINALRELVTTMVKAGAPTRFAWRGFVNRTELLATVHPAQAMSLVDVLNAVTPATQMIIVEGEVVGLDRHDGSFHFRSADKDFRGVVADGVMGQAKEAFELERTASAELEEQTAVGVLRSSKPKYVLRSIRAD